MDLCLSEVIELIGLDDVLLQRRRKVLRNDKDVFDFRIERIGDGNVDQTVFACKTHRGFAAALG